ncbi:hypothetical protein A3Q56_06685 [Intoshia linei]|uniref:Uncharacterized protein n=1 Tax=Intoshia linei TaxID=1819745 RepID=A0A177AUE0_9BILA|nr:hypothetical protein A3Q56_06685 [Intoshia linei]
MKIIGEVESGKTYGQVAAKFDKGTSTIVSIFKNKDNIMKMNHDHTKILLNRKSLKLRSNDNMDKAYVCMIEISL